MTVLSNSEKIQSKVISTLVTAAKPSDIFSLPQSNIFSIKPFPLREPEKKLIPVSCQSGDVEAHRLCTAASEWLGKVITLAASLLKYLMFLIF